MVWLKKKTPGSAPGYTWEHDGQVLDVDEELAQELLQRLDGEFTEGEPAGDEESTEVTEPDPGADEDPAEADGATEAKKPSRRRTKVAE